MQKKLQIPPKLLEIITHPYKFPGQSLGIPGTCHKSGDLDSPLYPRRLARSLAHSGHYQNQCLFQQGSVHHRYRLLLP